MLKNTSKWICEKGKIKDVSFAFVDWIETQLFRLKMESFNII